jgi:hypothetical protein
VKERSPADPFDWNPKVVTDCARKGGGAYETPMRLPEGEEGLLTGVVRTSDTVEINLDFPFRTTLGDGFR